MRPGFIAWCQRRDDCRHGARTDARLRQEWAEVWASRL
jgi:hypothetical protein